MDHASTCTSATVNSLHPQPLKVNEKTEKPLKLVVSSLQILYQISLVHLVTHTEIFQHCKSSQASATNFSNAIFFLFE